MKKNRMLFALLTLMLVTVAGCAPGAPAQVNIPAGQVNTPAMSFNVSAPGINPLMNTTGENGRPTSGLLLGVWQGVISPVTLVLSFVNPAIQMYEVHNDGSPYNFGFLLGVAIVFTLLGAFLGSRRH